MFQQLDCQWYGDSISFSIVRYLHQLTVLLKNNVWNIPDSNNVFDPPVNRTEICYLKLHPFPLDHTLPHLTLLSCFCFLSKSYPCNILNLIGYILVSPTTTTALLLTTTTLSCPAKNTRCVADDASNVIMNVTTRDDAECGGEYWTCSGDTVVNEFI